MFVQAKHVAEDPGWQVGDIKNYIHFWEIAKLLLSGIEASRCLLEAGHQMDDENNII